MERLPISCLAATDGNSLHRTILQKLFGQKETPTNQNTSKRNTPTTFRYPSEKPHYEPQYSDPQYEQDHSWDDDNFDQEKLEFKYKFDKSLKQIEDNDIITDSHVSDKLRYALIDLWTVNPLLSIISTLRSFRSLLNLSKCQNPFIDTDFIPQI